MKNKKDTGCIIAQLVAFGVSVHFNPAANNSEIEIILKTGKHKTVERLPSQNSCAKIYDAFEKIAVSFIDKI